MPKVTRAISDNGGIIMYALDSTDIVRDMERIHKTSAVASAALGRLLTAALLMSMTLKGENYSITVRVKGDGPLGMVLAVADGKGHVKGYVQSPNAYVPSRTDGKLDVGGAVGHYGTLSVVKDLGLKEPYIGQIKLVSGEIAQDITAYYATSEQTPTVCALGVLVDKDLSVLSAGGYLVQLLPGATDDEIDLLESNVSKATQISELIHMGSTAKDITDIVMKGFAPNILDETSVEYMCDCSKERVERALLSLGKAELCQMQQENDEVNIKCEFCDKSYNIMISQLLSELNTDLTKLE